MQKIRIDFDNPGLPQHISAVENDSQSRFFQATLYENGKAYTAPEGAAYSIMYRGFGPQNQGWYDTINDGAGKRAACAVSGNVVTCEIARQALQVPGHVSIVLCVTTGKGYMIKSWPIECDCKNDRYDSTAEIESFFYITQVSNADWNRAIQALEDLKNTIDPTLSISGKAADAKAIGTAIGQLKEDLSNLNSSTQLNTGFVEYFFTEDKYINTSGTTANINSPQDTSGYRYAVAECVEGDAFTVSGRGSVVAGLWAFIQSDGTIIEKSTTTAPETDIELTAPSNSAYLIVNSNRPAKCQKGTPIINLVKALQTEQAETDEYIDAIKVFEQKGNIFEAKTDAYEGAYYYRRGTDLIKGTNADYNCFIVPVTKNSLYTFVVSNIVLLDSNKMPILTGNSWDYEATTQCNSGDANYFAVSYRISAVPTDGYAISKGNALDYAPYAGEYYAKAVSESDKSTATKVSGSISGDNSLTVGGKTAIKDGQQIVFKGKFSSFNEVNIMFSGTGSTNSITVDSANLIINNDKNSTITKAHELSITNDITILLEIKKSTMFVSITSMGITFKFDCSWEQTGGTPSECVASANGMTFSDASLSVNYSAAKRGIWYFGDSYAKFGTDTRVPYYMIEYGYDKNVLFNAVSGGTSTGTIAALSTLVTYGSPSIAVFATGMNDGSDTGSTTPATNWMNRVQQFISMCESNNIEPVLCTVPTVPTVNHEAKNAWVRSSGYRYIDYASAVGANASGQWYTGMLSSNNVHPSTLGGNALFTQLITDLPEVMG